MKKIIAVSLFCICECCLAQNTGNSITASAEMENAEEAFEQGVLCEERLDRQCQKKWYEISAQQGYTLAEDKLADLLYFIEWGEKGNRESLDKAIYWYSKAADGGMANSQYHLASAYETGESIKPDINKALYYYERSANQGDSRAQMELALLHSNARDKTVPKNLVEARKWLLINKENGDHLSIKKLEEIELLMTQSQIDESNKLRKEWKSQLERLAK